MSLQVLRGGDEREFRLIGELDLATAAGLLDALEAELRRPGDLVVDLSELAFMDSSGLRTFLEVGRRLGTSGRLVLLNPGNAVSRVLEVTGLDQQPRVFEVRFGTETAPEVGNVSGEHGHTGADPAVPPSTRD